MEKELQENEHWDKVISSKKKLMDLHLKDVWDYKYLIKMFIKRDFIVAYKQTILGPIWYLIQPVFTAIMQTFIFGKMAGLGTDGIPYLLFYFTGSMLWAYFTACLNGCSATFTANQNIFGKVYFPRLVSPIATSCFHIIKLVIQFALFVVFYAYFFFNGMKIALTPYILLFPLVVIWIGVLGTGFGLIISSLTTKYRDLNIILGFGLHLAMYATPVVYPLSQIPEKFSWIAYINPMCAPVEFFRIAFFNAGSLTPLMYASSLGITFLVAFFGLVLFTKNERNFVDVI